MKKNLSALLKHTLDVWKKHNPLFMSAAISFYIILSLGPILVVMLFAFGLFFGKSNFVSGLISNIGKTAGPKPAALIQSIISTASTSSSRTATILAGIPLLFFGSTMVFFQLKYALNLIFEHTKKEKNGLTGTVKKYSLSFLMLFILGVLLLLLVIKTPVINIIRGELSKAIPVPWEIFRAFDTLVSFAILVLLFFMVYLILPDKKMKKTDILSGALITAVLFTIVQVLLAINVENSRIDSAYGAVGYFTVGILWIFYSSLVFLFGASVTKALSEIQFKTGNRK